MTKRDFKTAVESQIPVKLTVSDLSLLASVYPGGNADTIAYEVFTQRLVDVKVPRALFVVLCVCM